MNLVTGATGFIGRHLAERFIQEKKPLRLLCRPQSVSKLPEKVRRHAEITEGDIRDCVAVKKAMLNVNYVFHCAAHVSDWGDEKTFVETNVTATESLLREAVKVGVERFVHLSSIAVFGVPSPQYFDDASSYGAGHDLYSRTKIESEKLVFEYGERYALPVTILRPAVVYGQHGTWSEEPLKMIKLGKMFLLGNGSGTCHPCYIDNLVDAIMLVAQHPAAVGQAYIVGDGESVSFGEYFNHLARIAGAGPLKKSIPLKIARGMATALETTAKIRRAKERPLLTHTAIDMVTTRSRMSMAKIRDELGFQPRFCTRAAMDDLARKIA